MSAYRVLICDSTEGDSPAKAWRVLRHSIWVCHSDLDCYALAIRPYPGHPGGFVSPRNKSLFPDGDPAAASLGDMLWLTCLPEIAQLDALDIPHVEVWIYRIWLDIDEQVVRLQRMPCDAGMAVLEGEEM